MSILKSKIIRNFVNTIYLFGLNASSEVRQIIINYLEKVFNYKLDNETKDILLNDRLSLEEINLFFRKYKYMLLDGDEVGELEEVKKALNTKIVLSPSLGEGFIKAIIDGKGTT